jgi:hypothetical protein
MIHRAEYAEDAEKGWFVIPSEVEGSWFSVLHL